MYTSQKDTLNTSAPFYTIDCYPSGINFEPEERDNLTNFAQGPLGDALP